jgi:hypothetical protein
VSAKKATQNLLLRCVSIHLRRLSPAKPAETLTFGKMSDSFFAILSLMWAIKFTFDRGFGGRDVSPSHCAPTKRKKKVEIPLPLLLKHYGLNKG